MKYAKYEPKFNGKGERASGKDYSMQIEDLEGKSDDSFIHLYFAKDHRKLMFLSIDFLIGFINENKSKNILSLGAGPCINEYILKMCIPPDCKITATDFNSFQIKRANKFFKNITAKEFDFTKDDVKKLGNNFDLVIFLHSSFTMNDYEFLHLIVELKKLGVKHIIDFSGLMPIKRIPKQIFEDIWFKFKNRLETDKKTNGKILGYVRSKGEIRKLYQKAGLKVVDEVDIGIPNYRIFVIEV